MASGELSRRIEKVVGPVARKAGRSGGVGAYGVTRPRRLKM